MSDDEEGESNSQYEYSYSVKFIIVGIRVWENPTYYFVLVEIYLIQDTKQLSA